MATEHNGEWLRLYADMTDNAKLRMLPESAQLLYIWHLCLWKRGKAAPGADVGGLAWSLRVDVERARRDYGVLVESGLLLADLTPKGWDERQFQSDSSTERMRLLRLRRNECASHVRHMCVTATPSVTNRDDSPPTPPSTEPESESDTLPRDAGARASRVRVRGEDPGFDRLWAAYPRKSGRDAAREAWDAALGRMPPVDEVVAAAAAQAASFQWTREGGRFVPGLAKWLGEGRWSDEPSKVSPEVRSAKGVHIKNSMNQEDY